MRKLYTVLAWTIAGAVVVQAAAIAFAFGGMLNLVSEGGVVDKALLESFQAGRRRRARVHDPRPRGRRPHPPDRARAARRLVLRASTWREAVGRHHLRARRAAGDPRLLDHRHAVPRADPRSQRARRRGRGVGRGPACRTPTRRSRRLAPPRGRPPMPSRRDLLRCAVVGVAVTTALGAGALAWSSTLLGEYSVMDMGDGRGGDTTHGGPRAPRRRRGGAAAASGAVGSAGSVSVTSLTADPDRPADVRVELVARQESIDVPGGRSRRRATPSTARRPGPRSAHGRATSSRSSS